MRDTACIERHHYLCMDGDVGTDGLWCSCRCHYTEILGYFEFCAVAGLLPEKEGSEDVYDSYVEASSPMPIKHGATYRWIWGAFVISTFADAPNAVVLWQDVRHATRLGRAELSMMPVTLNCVQDF